MVGSLSCLNLGTIIGFPKTAEVKELLSLLLPSNSSGTVRSRTLRLLMMGSTACFSSSGSHIHCGVKLEEALIGDIVVDCLDDFFVATAAREVCVFGSRFLLIDGVRAILA